MIYRIISAAPAPGKTAEAIKWLNDITAYMNEHYKDAHFEAVMSMDGPTMLHSIARYESLTALDEVSKQWALDPKSAEVDRESPVVFPTGEIHFFQSL
jgi:hypothetical protein